MGVFWAKGYYDTSIDSLVDRTGLHRAAVYGEFGSKQRLFEAALRRYRETVAAGFLTPLTRRDPGVADIDRFFRGIHRAACRPRRRIGCLMINTASEVSPHVRPVARIVATFLGDLRGLFVRASTNARTRGEIRPEVDVARVADYLVGSVLGLWTLARSPASASALRHYVEGVLEFMDALRVHPRRRHPPARKGADRR